jgi:hypothetical protein
VSDPVDVSGLIGELRGLCERTGAASASASYVSPLEGRFVTLHVTAGGIAYVADEDGNVLPVLGGPE